MAIKSRPHGQDFIINRNRESPKQYGATRAQTSVQFRRRSKICSHLCHFSGRVKLDFFGHLGDDLGPETPTRALLLPDLILTESETAKTRLKWDRGPNAAIFRPISSLSTVPGPRSGLRRVLAVTLFVRIYVYSTQRL